MDVHPIKNVSIGIDPYPYAYDAFPQNSDQPVNPITRRRPQAIVPCTWCTQTSAQSSGPQLPVPCPCPQLRGLCQIDSNLVAKKKTSRHSY